MAAGPEPDRIGPYQLLDKLASGGMATVYLARRLGAAGFARLVALKVVHPHLGDDPGFTEMFLDEARLSARIDHPAVVRVEDFGEADGRYYLAMEYVRGRPLFALLQALVKRQRRLSPRLAVWIASQVAEGLHAAHEATAEDGQPLGIVHRDVSPQNVMLSYDGHAKVLDFGVAKAAGRIHQTRESTLKGKLAYMAPEQAWAREVDRRSDVFALGIVLWETLAGRRLFRLSDDVATLIAVREARVRPPSELGADVPPSLDAAVLAALAKDPDDRPPTAAALADALLEALPEARTVRPADVSALVRSVFAKELERDLERERTPSPSSPAMRPTAEEEAAAWTQLTRSLPEGGLVAEASTLILPGADTEVVPPRVASTGRGGRRAAVLAGLGITAIAAAITVASLVSTRERPEPPDAVEPAAATGEAPPATERGGAAEPEAVAAADRDAGAREREAPVEAAESEAAAAEAADAGSSEREARARRRVTERRAATRRPPVEGRPGRLTVHSVPWATIAVGGRPHGQTPRTIELPPGPHTVVLRPEGTGPPQRIRVVVPPGGVVTRRITF